MKKIILYLSVAIFSFFLLFFLINQFDETLNSNVELILKKNSLMSDEDNLKCSKLLAIGSPADIDSDIEGRKLLDQLKATPSIENNYLNDIKIPNFKSNLKLVDPCKGICNFTNDETTELKTQLPNEKIYIDRLLEILKGNNFGCKGTNLHLKKPILAYFNISKHYLMFLNLKWNENLNNIKIRDGIALELEHFYYFNYQLLNNSSFSLIEGLIYEVLLNKTKNFIHDAARTKHQKSIELLEKIKVLIQKLSFNTLVQNAVEGEVILASALLSYPFSPYVLELTNIAPTGDLDSDLNKKFPDNILSHILNLIYLPNQTLNEHFRIINEVVKLDCIKNHSTEITEAKENNLNEINDTCSLNSRFWGNYFYNLPGKYMLDLVMTKQAPHWFQKLHKRFLKLQE